jgi:rhodanese-related sulfurtransferase
MPSPTDVTPAQLVRRIGLPDAPVLIDVRIDDDHGADPRMLPTAFRRSHRDVAAWASAYAGRNVVITCQRGAKLSQGAAAYLRQAGAVAESLEGGFEAWRDAGLPVAPAPPPEEGLLPGMGGPQ